MRAACWDCGSKFWLKVQKASEKALALVKDHLELSLRQIQATQMTASQFWTRQKRLESCWTSNENVGSIFHCRSPHNSFSLWNGCAHFFCEGSIFNVDFIWLLISENLACWRKKWKYEVRFCDRNKIQRPFVIEKVFLYKLDTYA